jgi:hypothetical protein
LVINLNVREGEMLCRDPQPVWKFSDFDQYVPKYGWIRDYVQYAVQCTDAPPLFHILAATGVVSSAIAPHIDLMFYNVPHPLHLFLLIVGDSSEGRKTSAIKRAERVARPVFEALNSPGERIYWPMVSSPEGITDDLATEPNRMMLLSEWTDLHRLSSKGGYWQHASEFWNTVYDATSIVRSKSGTKVTVPRPRVTILGASTPSLVSHATSAVDWSGGKLARYIVGCMSRPIGMTMATAIDLPNEVESLRVRLGQLVSPPLNSTALVSGSCHATMSDKAWQAMFDWQHSDWWTELKERAPMHLRPAFGRSDEHVLRLSAIFEASVAYPYNVQVSEDSMLAAIRLLEWCYDSMIQTFALASGDDDAPRGSPLGRVTAALQAAADRGLTRSALLRQTRVSAFTLNDAINTLIERNEIRIIQDTTGGRPRITYYYVINHD